LAPDEMQAGTEKELAVAAPMLERGWATSIPDFEGTQMHYGAGRIAAHVVLDAIRATYNFQPPGIGPANPVGLAGYSGGGQGTAWAVEQQPSYAPELHITAAAPGGVPGAPLSAPSCNPPRQTSDYLTVGTPDLNGKAAASTGRVLLTVIGENPINPGNGDQDDVQITTSLTDVRNKSDLSDTTGELQAVLGLRVTDRYNGATLNDPATVTDTPLSFALPCSATTGPEGGSCNLTTTADAVMSGELAREGQRAVWELSQVEVYDGGSDGDADTTGDNTLFAMPGAFAP
jgi:secretory lipase